MGSEPTRYCQKLDSSKRGVAVASGVWPSHRVPLALSVLVLLFIGFALRIYRIAYQSVWWDEAYSLYVAQDGVTAMLGLPSGATQIHWDQPPLYYGLLSLWVRLVGSSEFALRSLSLFFGVLVLAAVYRIARTCFDRTTALTAMSIAVLSPTYVVYSQEVRVYALLPLVYLLQLTILHRLVDASGDPPLRLWVALSVVEALSLYLHYFTVLGILYINVFLVAVWLGQRRHSFRHLIGSQFLAVALYAPWMWNMIRHWSYFRARASIQVGLAVGPGPLAFAWRMWRFIIGGNEAAVGNLPLLELAVAFVAVVCGMALLLVVLIRHDTHFRQTYLMLAHTLGPLVLCFAAWQLWPEAHPRYALVFSAPLFVAIGRWLAVLLIEPGEVKLPRSYAIVLLRLAGMLLAGSLALAFGAGLWVQYFEERFHKDDVRGVAAYLKQVATAEDVILIGPDDHSVPYYYDGPATVAMAQDEPRTDKVLRLGEITTDRQRLFLVHWQPSKADLHGLYPFLLERTGRLVVRRDFRGLDVWTYELDNPTGLLPDLIASDASDRFGPLLLTGTYYEPAVTTDNAVAVALRWQLVEPTNTSYKAVVMLSEGAGRRLSSTDVLMLDENGRRTDWWPAGLETGSEVVNFYVVPVPAGMVPVAHLLNVGVYDADTLVRLEVSDTDDRPSGRYDLSLGEVALVPGKYVDHDPYGTRAGVEWEEAEDSQIAEGISLKQFAVVPRTALVGEEVRVLLRWQAEGLVRPPATPVLRLLNGGQVWAEVGSHLLDDVYPFDHWAVGEIVIEERWLTYPPRRGSADLVLGSGDRSAFLGQVWLDESRLKHAMPADARGVGVQVGDFAELLGYDLPSDKIAVGQPFDVTLYWRPLNQDPLETQYTVFTQLLAADGHLVAQHDGPPAGNSRPTTTWIAGEVVEDVHMLTFEDLTYTGPAGLIVGLYDSETILRVITVLGQDHIRLSEDIVVETNAP